MAQDVINSLQIICFKITIRQVDGLTYLSEPGRLQLLFPKIHSAIVSIQRLFRFRMVSFENRQRNIDLICSKHRNEEWLKPSNAKFYKLVEWPEVLQKGHHVVVYRLRSNVYHHGIFVDEGQEKRFIHCDINTSAIAYCSAKDFFNDYHCFGIVIHDCYLLEGYNEETVNLAQKFEGLPPSHTLQHYDLLKWNCECFAWACVTRCVKADSEQVKQMWKDMKLKLSQDEQALVATFVTLAQIFIHVSCYVQRFI